MALTEQGVNSTPCTFKAMDDHENGPVPGAGDSRGKGTLRGRMRGRGRGRGRGGGRGSRGGAGPAGRRVADGPQSPTLGSGGASGSRSRRGVFLDKWKPMYEFLESLPPEEGPIKKAQVREWLASKWDDLPEELKSTPEEKIMNYACHSHWRLLQRDMQLQQKQRVKKAFEEEQSEGREEDAADDHSTGDSGRTGEGKAGPSEGTDRGRRPGRSSRRYNTRRRRQVAASVDDEAQTRRQVLQPQLYTPELGYPQVLRQEGLLAQMKRGEAVTSMLDVYNSLVLLHKRVSLSLGQAGGNGEGSGGPKEGLPEREGQRKVQPTHEQEGEAMEGFKAMGSSLTAHAASHVSCISGAARFTWPPGSSRTVGATVEWREGDEAHETVAEQGEERRGGKQEQEAGPGRTVAPSSSPRKGLRVLEDIEMQEGRAVGQGSALSPLSAGAIGDGSAQDIEALQGAGATVSASHRSTLKEDADKLMVKRDGEGSRAERRRRRLSRADGGGEDGEDAGGGEAEDGKAREEGGEGEEGEEEGQEEEGEEEEVEEEEVREEEEEEEEEEHEDLEEQEEEDEDEEDGEEDGNESDGSEEGRLGGGRAILGEDEEEPEVEDMDSVKEEEEEEVEEGGGGEEGEEGGEVAGVQGGEHERRAGGPREQESAGEGLEVQEAREEQDEDIGEPHADWSEEEGENEARHGSALWNNGNEVLCSGRNMATAEHLLRTRCLPRGAEGISWPILFGGVPAEMDALRPLSCLGLSAAQPHGQTPPAAQLDASAGGESEAMEEAAWELVSGQLNGHGAKQQGQPASATGLQDPARDMQLSGEGSGVAVCDLRKQHTVSAVEEGAPRVEEAVPTPWNFQAVREGAEGPGSQAGPAVGAGVGGPLGESGGPGQGRSGASGGAEAAGSAGAAFVSWGPTLRAAPLGICVVPQPLLDSGSAEDATTPSVHWAARERAVVGVEGEAVCSPAEEAPAGKTVAGVPGKGQEAPVGREGRSELGILSALGRRELAGAGQGRPIPPWPVQSSGRTRRDSELLGLFSSPKGPASSAKRKRTPPVATLGGLEQVLGRRCRLPAGPGCGRVWASVSPSFLMGWAGLPGRHRGPVARLQQQHFVAQWQPAWALYTTHFAAAPVGRNAEQVVAQKVLDVRFRPWPAEGPSAWEGPGRDGEEGDGEARQPGAPGEGAAAGESQAGTGSESPDLRGAEGSVPEATRPEAGSSPGADAVAPGTAAAGRPRAMGPQLVCGCNEAPNELLAIDLRVGVPMELNGHACQIQAVEYALQGDAIVSCGANLLKVWDASSGTLRFTLGIPVALAPSSIPEPGLALRGRGSGRGRGRGRGSYAAHLEMAGGGDQQDEAPGQRGESTQPGAGGTAEAEGPGGAAVPGQLIRGHEGKVLALAVNAWDSSLVASSSSGPDTQVLLWNVHQGQQMQRLGGAGRYGRVYQEDHNPPMDVLRFLGPEALLGGSDVVGSTGGSRLCVWDLDTGRRTVNVPALNSYVTSLAVDPLSSTGSSGQSSHPQAKHGGARVLLCGAGDGSAGLFDLRQAQPMMGSLVAGGSGCETTTVGFSPCGTYVHASFNANCALVWDRRILPSSRDASYGTGPKRCSSHRGGARPVHLLSHGPPVPGVQHSAQYPGYVDFGDEGVNDAKWFHGSPCLATASGNGTVALWDVTCGVPLMTSFKAHSRAINSLDIVADDSCMASAGDDQKVVLYQRKQDSAPSAGSRCSTATWHLTHSLV